MISKLSPTSNISYIGVILRHPYYRGWTDFISRDSRRWTGQSNDQIGPWNFTPVILSNGHFGRNLPGNTSKDSDTDFRPILSFYHIIFLCDIHFSEFFSNFPLKFFGIFSQNFFAEIFNCEKNENKLQKILWAEVDTFFLIFVGRRQNGGEDKWSIQCVYTVIHIRCLITSVDS